MLNLSRGQQQEALADYEHLLSLYSDDAQILANRADLLLALGRVGDAQDDIARALELDSASSRARFTHALILATLAQHEQAKSAYAELLQDDPAGVSECFRRIGVQLRPEAMDFRLVWFWVAIRRQQVCNWNDLDSFVDALDRFAEHSSRSYEAWSKARPADDFKTMIPLLEKTLDLKSIQVDDNTLQLLKARN